MPLAQAIESVTEDVVLFSYGGCPYCRKLEQVLKAEGIPFAVLDYDADLGAYTDARLTPDMVIKGMRRHPPPIVLSGAFNEGCVTTASPHTAGSPGMHAVGNPLHR